MRSALTLLAPAALAACAAAPAPSPASDTASTDGIARAGLNQRVYVDGPYVTPLEVLEDSRCPADVQCIRAGLVRLKLRIDLGSRSETREIASFKPIEIADGQLSLVEVHPGRLRDRPVKPEEYRFGFRFAGGL